MVGGNRGGEKSNNMADFATPEYEKLIAEFMRRNQQQVAQANAMAQGEAQRRGLVGSDIEMALRGARTQPIVEAGQGQVAGLLQQMSDQRLQDQRTQQAQQYGTSERLGGQQFQTGENLANRNWQTGERQGNQQFQSNMAGYTDPNTGQWVQTGGAQGGYGAFGGQQAQNAYDERMANMQRQWQLDDAKKKKKGMWGDIGAGIIGGVAGGFGQGIGTGVGYRMTKG